MAVKHLTDLSAEFVRARFSYDPATGIVIRKRNQTRPWLSGLPVGTANTKGHLQICVKSKLYNAHRLIWLMQTGEWPRDQIDHINGDKTDNRWANLREATNAQNRQNTKAPMGSNPYLGVTWSAVRGKWRARIGHAGKCWQIGIFDTPEQARDAYLAEKRRIHPFGTL